MELEKLHRRMIEGIRRLGVKPEVVEAMEKVPRHLFVPEDRVHEAYDDHPLPIGDGQTISAPHMVAMMCDLLDIEPGNKILEVGGGSGYHAAVMAELVGKDGEIYTIERFERLAEFARENLKRAGYENVKIFVGDGSLGLPEFAPYDRINVTCAAPSIPPPLLDQLRVGGRMVIPIGRYMQELYLVEKREDGIHREIKGDVVFVPLIGKYGFRE
ncbi:MAG TPA: protein-L-isoaspartate(D-aspartate) O-methyltransferase [Candidatus Syntrophoarchaeum butanivorans]|uniref:Protein-L-isoaspartate O-methyltransferase n=3 Tax=Candidatus Syntropharchaeum butanivorans TaxID=1839936 RepID=A0A1F2P421_9EURY|nr:MAG: Protein-L-isoaspartate(D-aspartate) O-methyltransferase [Candidatus Syntrophoarchaeum butanivorans]RJS72767.1 MAG: protein-L-isoaspartate(D-aspartate) O-methyltransferase [Candidatus Syntrophoarchaeum sp. WYZ-LMO15]HEC57458.1 protein-L-isoaspartate(D-aspartate) O-methyltransferase [Candidatus Syntrophoarchaeum butanivorans]